MSCQPSQGQGQTQRKKAGLVLGKGKRKLRAAEKREELEMTVGNGTHCLWRHTAINRRLNGKTLQSTHK